MIKITLLSTINNPFLPYIIMNLSKNGHSIDSVILD